MCRWSKYYLEIYYIERREIGCIRRVFGGVAICYWLGVLIIYICTTTTTAATTTTHHQTFLFELTVTRGGDYSVNTAEQLISIEAGELPKVCGYIYIIHVCVRVWVCCVCVCVWIFI